MFPQWSYFNGRSILASIPVAIKHVFLGNYLLSTKDKVLWTVAGAVEQHEDINVIGDNILYLKWKTVGFPQGLDLDIVGLLLSFAEGKYVNRFGIP